MDDTLEQKLVAVLTFFYKDLFVSTYSAEITKVIDEHSVLPIVDEALLENMAFIWCLSYYLVPMVNAYSSSDNFEKLIEAISSFTGIDKHMILTQNEKAQEYLGDGPMGAFQFYWFLFNKIGNNKIPEPRNPFVSPMFLLMATQLIEYGAKGLEAIQKDFDD